MAGGSAHLGCAADPSDPRRRRRQPAAKGLTSPVVARIRRKHRRPRRPCQRIWQCAPIYSSSAVTTAAQSAVSLPLRANPRLRRRSGGAVPLRH